MRAGFFGGRAPAAKPAEPSAPQGADHGSGTASPAAPPPQPPATAALSAEQRERGLEQCLQLLKGPSDETRFVGLLLVTKILPVGDEATIKRVFDAMGFTFLSRLLLPLQTPKGGEAPPAAAADPEALAKQVAMARLGLAVLSSFVHLPELAGSEDMVEKLPLFLKVAREGGVAPALAAAGAAPGPSSAAAAAEEEEEGAASAEVAAVEDALECALAVAQSGQEGQLVALESGALGAAAAVLQRWAAAATGSAGFDGTAATRGSGLQACLLAVRLAWVALGGGESVQAAIEGHSESVERLIPPLASLLALPATLPAARSPPPSAAGSGSSAAGAATAGPAPDVAALQLEVLHLLHLLLVHATAGDAAAAPLCAALSHAAQAALPPQLSWADWVREGLGVVLRGRVSPSERHTALQLAAAVVELCGPEWLLGPCNSGTAGAAAAQRAGQQQQQQQQHKRGGGGGRSMGSKAMGSSKEGGSAGSFYQLLVEMVKIETSVLLLDALAPAAPVPLAGQWVPPLAAPGGRSGAGSASSEAGLESGTEDEGEEEGRAEGAAVAGGSGMDVGEIGAGADGPAFVAAGTAADAAAGGGSADVGMLREVLRSEGERAKLEERWREEERRQQQQQHGDGGALQGGEAAAQLAGLARKVDEMELPSEIRWQGPSETAGERAARQLPACFLLVEVCIEALAQDAEREEERMEGKEGATSPQLSEAVALRAMNSLHEVCEGLLQFLEQTVGGATGSSGSEAAREQDPGRRALVAAAVRVVGRFCGEAPDAFGPRLRQLLPSLLAYFQAQVGEEGGSGGDSPLPFLLPALLVPVAPAEGGSSGEREKRKAWVQTLGSEQVLPHLANYASAAANAFCHAHELPPEQSSAADMQAAGARLHNAGALLLPVVAAGLDGGSAALADHLAAQLLRVAEALLQEQPLQLSELRLLGICVALLASLAVAAVTNGAGSRAEASADTALRRTSLVVLHCLRLTVEAIRQLEGSNLLQPGGSVLVGVGIEEDGAELLLDLAQNLHAIATAAAHLLQCSPCFAAACCGDGWLGGVLAGGGLPALGLSHETLDEAPGLKRFLHAAMAAQAAERS